MTNEQLFLAEAVTDFLAKNDWLNERDMRTVSTLRHDCVCKHSPVGAYKCYVELKFSQQSGAKSICVDTCLQDEIWRLNKKHGIRTIGCCCGHGVTPPYIQVAPDDDNIEQMYLLGYEMDHQEAESPWHSMEDNGPPEENGPYFVYAPSYRGGSSSEKERARGVMISKWTGKHWSIEVGYYKRPGCVTHWMPIEPPKEDADGK